MSRAQEADWLLMDMQAWCVCLADEDQRVIKADGTWYVEVEQLVRWLRHRLRPDLDTLLGPRATP